MHSWRNLVKAGAAWMTVIAISLVCAGIGQSVARAEEPEADESALELLRRKDFAALEKMAADLRASKARTEDGRWRLDGFYNVLSPSSKQTAEGYWKVRFAIHEAWRAAYPKSITAHIAHAEALHRYAWSARGGGYAHTVTPEGWKLFSERLAQSRVILEAADKLPEKCIRWFPAIQTVALGQGWNRADYEALYQRAIAAEPTYYTPYFRKAYFLLPRWHGAPGEWERYAEEAAKRDNPGEGMTMYARIAWANSEYYDNLFKESGVQWEKMKQGFRDMEKTFPKSTRNLNAFCRFAFEAGDMETTRELLARIGNKPLPAVWSVGSFGKARRWIHGDPAPRPDESVLAVPENPGTATRLAFSPDGKSLAVAYQNGNAIIWNLAEKKPIWTIEGSGKSLSAVAFSADGKLLALSSRVRREGESGVKVYEPSTRREVAEIGGWSGLVGRVEFTPDGKTLVMVGGKYQEKSQGQLWDVATGTVQPLGWPKEHNHHLEAISISPDSRLMAAECGHAINVWDFTKRDFIFFTQQTAMKEWVWDTAFSPDGQLLAAAAGPEWSPASERSKPGRLLLWETAGWKERKHNIAGRLAGLATIAFSPDSRLIATGDYDARVRVWEIASGKEVATFEGHERIVRSVAFSPDGQTLASSSADGTVRLWKVPQ